MQYYFRSTFAVMIKVPREHPWVTTFGVPGIDPTVRYDAAYEPRVGLDRIYTFPPVESVLDKGRGCVVVFGR